MKEAYGWWLPIDISTHGAGIDQLINVLHWFMLVLFVGWGIFFVYCLVKFRARPGHSADPTVRSFKFPKYLEVGVAIFEMVLLIFLSSPIWYDWKQNPPAIEDSLVVRVWGEQFAWNIHYPGPDGRFGKMDLDLVDGVNPLGLDREEDPDARDDIVTINDFHVPVNKPVIAHLRSKDVIHSFALPVMRVKQDVIPGMNIPIWFEATQPFEGEIACAQLCGSGHYRMRGQFTVATAADYDSWMEEQVEILQEELEEEE